MKLPIRILIAMLCGGSGIVLISEGPIGMLIGFILSFLVLMLSHAMGKKAIDEKLMNANLPVSLRKIALGDALPRVEGSHLGLSSVGKGRIGRMLSGETEQPEDEPSEKRARPHLLPRIRWADSGDLSARRMQAIKNRIRSNYEKLLNSADNEDLLALNARMSRDISDQIEARLKELAEQVEIPL